MIRPPVALALLLAACAPSAARIAERTDQVETDDPPLAGCPETPPDLADLAEVPVTVFYQGPLAYDAPPETPTWVESTAIQREWSVVRSRWAPEGADFGNLDADPQAGHGVLLAAFRSSTCGLRVDGVRAWALNDGSKTTYVEARFTDTSGACEETCDAEDLTGAAVAVPIVDFPFSGPILGCVVVEDDCG